MAFLHSMSDVFHARVSADFLGRVFATMALTPQHTCQILTKRPNRMRELLTNGRVHAAAMRTAPWTYRGTVQACPPGQPA
jgi:protein gp37